MTKFSLPLLPPCSNEGPEVSLRNNFRNKDVCRYALEHSGGLMRLFSPEIIRHIPRPFPFRSRISVARVHHQRCLSLDTLFAVDKAKINLYGKSGQLAEVNVWSTRQ